MERQQDDLALRKQALKLRLAAQAEKLVAHIEALDEPTTPLEAERMNDGSVRGRWGAGVI